MTDTHQKFGPVKLAPGVLPRHVACYLFAAFVSIGLFIYLVALTPYILTVNLGLPESAHGRIAGDLQFWQEIALLATLGLWGALSDRFGRRLIYIIGFLILFAAYGLYAFATTPSELIAYRLIFAVGVSATTTCLSAVLADYPEEKSRGILTGIAFFLNGVGSVIFIMGLTQLPEVFANRGVPDIWAGRYAYFTVAAIAFVAALAMLGLKPGRPDETEPKTPILTLLLEGVTAGKNFRITLSYLSSYAARMNMAIVALFLFLWVVQAATAAGATATEATARAGMIVGISQIAAVIAAPVLGMLGDKIDRLNLLILTFAIGTIGYGWVAVLNDILAVTAIPALLLVGIGLSGAQLASTVLLAEESPARIRGSTFGVQAVFGALGILSLSAGGGRLFDTFGPNAPFVAVAIANAVVLVCAVPWRLVELKRGVRTGPPQTAPD
ncbi:MAG: MFS transporter [Gammaproteobacteria bacterium]|nr:MFS transporter [Gammaproteobacteria bacterium]